MLCLNSDQITLTGASPVGGSFSGDGIDGYVFHPFEAGLGSHQIEYHFENESGCLSSTSFAIEVVSSGEVSISTPDGLEVCSGGSVTLTESSGDNYQWYKDGEVISNATNRNYAAHSYGFYTVKVGANGCSGLSSSVEVIIHNLPEPEVEFPGNPGFCEGSSVELSTQIFESYQWKKNGSPVEGANSHSFEAGEAGNYSVTVSDENGCTGTSEIVAISGSSSVAITTNVSPALCPGKSVTLKSSSASTYQWFRNGEPISDATTQTYTTEVGGIYHLVATDANGCMASSTEIEVSNFDAPPLPVITVTGGNEFCEGKSNRLATSTHSGYQWYRDGNSIPGATSASYANTNGGEFSVTITDLHGCKASSEVSVITVNPNPSIDLGPVPSFNEICSPETLGLSVPATENTVYQWFRNNDPIPGGFSNSYEVSSTGLYFLEASSEKGCSSSSRIIFVKVKESPAKPLISLIDVNLLSSSSAQNNQWYLNGNALIGETGTTLVINQNGLYSVIVTNANGCFAASDEFNLDNVGLSAPGSPTKWRVYPNPFNSTITLESDVETSYLLVDMSGKLVAQGRIVAGKNQLDLSSLASGIYQLNAFQNSDLHTLRINKH